jgi:hypothetical protein
MVHSPLFELCYCTPWILHLKLGPTERLALSWGKSPAVYETAAVAAEPHRQCRLQSEGCRIKVTLHSPFRTLHLKWWVATVLPRALRFKRPLHRCNACNPIRDAKAELNRRSQACEILAGTGIRVA